MTGLDVAKKSARDPDQLIWKMDLTLKTAMWHLEVCPNLPTKIVGDRRNLPRQMQPAESDN
jgi:hypothetical protein